MSKDLTLADINGVCRLCLKGDGTIIPIFGRENTSRDCIHLSKKILDCVSVKVAEEDGMPSMICVGCVHQVDSWHGFKNMCESSQKKLNSWLKKFRPEIYIKNQAALREENCAIGNEVNNQTYGVIDLSSEDEDDVVETSPTETTNNNSRVLRSRLSRPFHSNNLIDITLCSSEIEITPISPDNTVSLKDNENSSSNNLEYNTGPAELLPVTESNATVDRSFLDTSSLKDHFLPDTESPNNCSDQGINDSFVVEKETKDLESNETDTTALCKNSNEATVYPEEVTSNESESPVLEHENQSDPVGDNEDDNFERLEKQSEERCENSQSNGSSLVIEKVTSLTNGDSSGNVEDTTSKDEDEIEDNNVRGCDMEIATIDSKSVSSNNDDSQEIQPDIVMCETPMVLHIKEEPMSAGEASGTEDDPLNFHNVTIKRELTDGFVEETNEPEDIKPNVQQLREAIENLYTPKKLKSGKVHCEPCRVSFLNDIAYERHTLSLRHKLNLRLFRSGKAPTRRRGRALVSAIMGSNYEYPKQRGKGYFQCNLCPSRYLHSRNLTTHKKKHLLEMQKDGQEEREKLHFQDISELSQDRTHSPKSIQRASAQNVKFLTKEELKCELCNRFFSTTPALYSHRRFCGFSGSHNCSWCNQNFTTQSLLFKHRKECLKFLKKQAYIKSLQNKSKNIPSIIPAQEVTPAIVPLDGTVLACTLCNLKFKTSPDLISHMQRNHMDFGKQKSAFEVPIFDEFNVSKHNNVSHMHYCKYCMKSFSSQMSMSSHTGYHVRANLYYCKFCPQNYTDKVSLRQHMKVHIADPSLNKIVCWICYTPFASQNDLINHKDIHINMKMKIFSCNICSNSYNTKELLSKHRRNAHRTQQPVNDFDQNQFDPVSENVVKDAKILLIDEDNKLYKCKICKKKFSSKGNLSRHSTIHKRAPIDLSIVKVEHTYQNRCNWCLQSFKNKVGLANHRPFCLRYKIASAPLSSLSANAPVKCKGCKKWYSSKSSLWKHKKRCPGKSPVPTNMVEISLLKSQNCPNCDQQFLSEESLERHKQHCKPSIDRLTCDCGEVFSSVDQKLTHADSCPANCTCKACNLKFNSPEELESHQSICKESYPSPSQSQQNPSTPSKSSFAFETRLPSAECSKCNKKFIYGKCLKLHEEKCLKDKWPCQICMEVFSSDAALANHRKYRGQCQNPRLIRSSSTSSLNEGPTFKCESCLAWFTSGNELKQHSLTCGQQPVTRRRTLGNYEDRPFACDQCDKRFLWSANLYRHKKNSHTTFQTDSKIESSTTSSPVKTEKENSYFKCDLCPDIIFHKKQGLSEHQLVHNRDLENTMDFEDQDKSESSDLLTCELCDKKLPESLYHLHMDEHMNDDFEESRTDSTKQAENSATPEQKFACDLCGKEFLSHSSRKSHRATHFRNKSVSGISSSKTSSRSSSQKKFKAKHVRCLTCYKLLSVNSMPKHKMMHHREAAEFYGKNENATPSKTCQEESLPNCSTPNLGINSDLNDCPDLNNTPELPYSLRKEETDEGPQTYPCTKCDRTFILRKTLLDHLKDHQDDSMETESTSSATGSVDQYPYKCIYCDLSWKFKSVYERHLSSKKHIELHKQLSSII